MPCPRKDEDFFAALFIQTAVQPSEQALDSLRLLNKKHISPVTYHSSLVCCINVPRRQFPAGQFSYYSRYPDRKTDLFLLFFLAQRR